MTASWLEDYLREKVALGVGSALGANPEADGLPPQLTVQKMTAYVPISDELAMDFGLIPDTRPPAPPVPWRRQLRVRWFNWRANTRQRIAERAYKLISGDEFPADDPYED